jgi:hypothetical protein
MNNRDIYLRSPIDCKLMNEGVASVNDGRTMEALSVLRYELETFVCSGQYESGMRAVLETFLKNIGEAQQPAVWLSGFYGAGKSHLAKMLRALWQNEPFKDGVTPREAASLPRNVLDLFSELDSQAARLGGKHAASGTLGSSARGSVRLAFLRLIFRSAGLPERYPHARFVMWLKREGMLGDAVRLVEKEGRSWEEELEDFYVSGAIHRALAALRPDQFPQGAPCAEILGNAYKSADDVSSSGMTKAISDALRSPGETAGAGTRAGFPLTLIVLDEVQQYIGTDASRSVEVQEAVEACCRDFGGRLMFIGTGQTAITGTINLKKLEGRFTVRVELSDADADTVMRKVILAKKPEAKPEIEKVMTDGISEIRRGLSGTSIGHRKEDIRHFYEDYPLLPARRRFWKSVLKALDQTGTDSQLRNQLGMMHRAIASNIDEPLGSILPADYIYFELADRLLQARVLPRRVHEKTMEWRLGTPTERMMARACGLVFLISRLAENDPEMGVSASSGDLADLMMDDLRAGSAALREALPEALERCVAEKILMRVGDGFRVQTEESVAWNDEFEAARAALANATYRLDAARDDSIRAMLGDILGGAGRDALSVPQGHARVMRPVHAVYDAAPPEGPENRITVLVRDGWKTDEESLIRDARMAGSASPAIFVFIPCASGELKAQIIDHKAAIWTLDKMGRPSSREGAEARAAIETVKARAGARMAELLGGAFAAARVFRGGGEEVRRANLREAVLEAARGSAVRLYPKFGDADQEGWAQACESARSGAADALEFIGGGRGKNYQKNPACMAISAFLASERSGADIRKNFESPPYGWPRDAIDGAIFVLLQAGAIKAADSRGRALDYRTLARDAIGRTSFKVESVSLSARERIEARRLMQMTGVQAKPDDEASAFDDFLGKLSDMARSAGGEAPLPPPPSSALISGISALSGNGRLLALYEKREEIRSFIMESRGRIEEINRRLPLWHVAEGLLAACGGMPEAEDAARLMRGIKSARGLLGNPDPVPRAVEELSRVLRDRLRRLEAEYDARHAEGMEKLNEDGLWGALEDEQRLEILRSHSLLAESKPEVAADSPEDILNTVSKCPLQAFSDRTEALPGRFGKALSLAARLLSPEAARIEISIPRAVFRTENEIDSWAEKIRAQLKTALKDGPVYIR